MCNFKSPECIAAMEYMRDLKWKYDILNADKFIVIKGAVSQIEEVYA